MVGSISLYGREDDMKIEGSALPRALFLSFFATKRFVRNIPGIAHVRLYSFVSTARTFTTTLGSVAINSRASQNNARTFTTTLGGVVINSRASQIDARTFTATLGSVVIKSRASQKSLVREQPWLTRDIKHFMILLFFVKYI